MLHPLAIFLAPPASAGQTAASATRPMPQVARRLLWTRPTPGHAARVDSGHDARKGERPTMRLHLIRTAAALALAGLAACGGEQPITTSNADFISVSKGPDASAVPGASTGSDEFYMAIRKDALGQRYFMSAYLTQLFPGAVSYGAARTLGTRVVTFRVQNGKLFVFDGSDIYKDSDTFDPEVLVDAYPIVTNSAANNKPGASNYVIFDPANGMNKFGVVGDAFAGGSNPVGFQVELSFLQRFRSIGDGVTWEQVFSGFANQAINDGMGGEVNALRASGTLGIALRKYGEGKGYTQTPMPDAGEFYFRADPELIPNTGVWNQPAAKWNIYRGMKPIHWYISNHIAALAKDPVYKGYDVYGAMKTAIESWNDAFGFKVVEASLATADQSFGDDDTNYVLWDEDPSFGAAFANWRTNPNTGEIRGASVYFNSLWLQIADQIFTDDQVKPIAPVRDQKKPFAPSLVWTSMRQQPLCMLRAPGLRGEQDEMAGMVRSIGGNASMTKKQKVEAYLAQTLVHEIGHTFGLRHNFKGSLVPPSSSVMDYLVDDDSLLSIRPGAYDIAAIQYLYGISKNLPTQPFCTDEDTISDPDCNRFDSTDAPLTKWFGPAYTNLVQKVLAGTSNTAPNTTLNGVLQYVRAGSPAQMQQAWAIATAGIAAPLPSTQTSNSTYAVRADILSRRVVQRLYLDAPQARGNFFMDLSPQNPMVPSILGELRGELSNVDGIRGFTTRRQSVDILKLMQSMPAYRILLDGQTTVQQQRAAATGDTAAYVDDLLSRINVALHPYFH